MASTSFGRFLPPLSVECARRQAAIAKNILIYVSDTAPIGPVQSAPVDGMGGPAPPLPCATGQLEKTCRPKIALQPMGVRL
jgi:hypothetical protein